MRSRLDADLEARSVIGAMRRGSGKLIHRPAGWVLRIGGDEMRVADDVLEVLIRRGWVAPVDPDTYAPAKAPRKRGRR